MQSRVVVKTEGQEGNGKGAAGVGCQAAEPVSMEDRGCRGINGLGGDLIGQMDMRLLTAESDEFVRQGHISFSLSMMNNKKV